MRFDKFNLLFHIADIRQSAKWGPMDMNSHLFVFFIDEGFFQDS